MRINIYAGLIPAVGHSLVVRLRDGYKATIKTSTSNACFNAIKRNPKIPVQQDEIYGFTSQKGTQWVFKADLDIVDVDPIIGVDGVFGSETAIWKKDGSYETVSTYVAGRPDSFSAKADLISPKHYEIIVFEKAVSENSSLKFAAADGRRIALITKGSIGVGDRKIAAYNGITLP